jgi:hypothetical protein
LPVCQQLLLWSCIEGKVFAAKYAKAVRERCRCSKSEHLKRAYIKSDNVKIIERIDQKSFSKKKEIVQKHLSLYRLPAMLFSKNGL